jgi:hypothetical protein
MSQLFSRVIRRSRCNLGLVAVVFCIIAATHTQATIASDDASPGRLDFEAAKLPAANVELDLSEGMLGDLANIGDAAVAGVVETVLKASQEGKNAHKDIHTTAEQLEAVNQIVTLLGGVVREVRVRAYESLPEEITDAQELFKPFDHQLKSAKWETILRVRDDEQIARVSVLRRDGKIQGVFVTASDGDAVVIANIVSDISPEKAKQLTAAVTKIGLKTEFKINSLPISIQMHTDAVIDSSAPLQAPVPPPSPAPKLPAAN